MALIAVILRSFVEPIIESSTVEQTVTFVLAQLAIFLLPFAALVASSTALRETAKTARLRAIVTSLIAAGVVLMFISVGQFLAKEGPFAPRISLQFTLGEQDGQAVIESVVEDGAADQAGLEVGDVIVGIRREALTKDELLTRISRAEVDAPIRLRFLRGDEEFQETARAVLVDEPSANALLTSFFIGFLVSAIALIWPNGWTPYVILSLLLTPLLIGYIWLIIATFSFRTEGILPLNSQGNVGGLGLDNWSFLDGQAIEGFTFNIWRITLNSLAIALTQMIVVLMVSSLAAYALSRMNFRGRKGFLSFTLILHGFPAVTLLIPVFFILRNLSEIPVLGDLIGFNTIGGIALVMVAFELPLGVWLMKGFFDNIPWDMERSAMIDGASRFRVYWQILLPQIRPGLLALGIFAFISGWNAYIIPQTYSVGSQGSNITVFMNQLIDETAPVNWNEVAAVGLFQLIPIFIFFIFAQEYLLNIYAGGSKGTS